MTETAYQIAERYAAGEISQEQMLSTLIQWSYAPSQRSSEEWQVTPALDDPGSFEETVGRAHSNGLISGEEYDAILNGSVEVGQR
jgi:hypothetical protein